MQDKSNSNNSVGSLRTNRSRFYLSREYLLSLRDFCIARKIDVFEVMKHADMPLQEFTDQSPYITEKVCYDFCSHVEDILQNPYKTGCEFGRWLALKNAHGNLGMAFRSSKNFLESCKLMEKYIGIRTNVFSFSYHADDEFLYLALDEKIAGLTETSQKISQFFVMTCLFNAEHFVRQSVTEIAPDFEVKVSVRFPMNESIEFNGIKILGEQEINGLRMPLSVGQASFSSFNEENYVRLVSLLQEEIKKIPCGGIVERVKQSLR